MVNGVRIGSLFSGSGQLDRAVQAVFGGEIAWQCESDPAASKVLAAHFPDVPNLGDVAQVDWAQGFYQRAGELDPDDIESVDIIVGGFPCQDLSAAGRRAGLKTGTRSGLWIFFADAIAALRPQIVIIENVRGITSARAHRTVGDGPDSPVEPNPAAVGDGSSGPILRALGAVLGDLSDLGYDAFWEIISAASIGAPHQRERCFIIAVDRRRGSATNADDVV